MAAETTLAKVFNHEEIERTWYERWLNSDVFTARENAKDPYVIMMPPPNVTGVLHNGHALFVTLQDILARFYRMKGRDVLWLPGTDHAGISTQTVVERELKKKEGLRRHELPRKDFLARVFAWKDKHGERIIEQLKLLGASADWSRLRFTMDQEYSQSVNEAFVRLWNDNLIFRKERLISWDPVAKTALSNEEVDHVDKDGEMFYFAYQLKSDPTKEIVVATTRPETMLGDTAVAVNPRDDRYKHMIGEALIHPFISDRVFSIIGDDYVDPSFGSGAVKITPAHDPNDFVLGERHQIPFINIFSLDASINQNGGEFSGLDRFKARALVKRKLTDLGLARKTEKIRHAVAISQRTGVDIEPMLSRQYFINMKSMAEKAYHVVDNGEVNIIPSAYKKIWDHFLLNIQDWCISRQLWWGHRIPIYYHVESMKKTVQNFAQTQSAKSAAAIEHGDSDEVILNLALNELSDDNIRSFSHAFTSPPENMHEYLQEEDVLDTWFSAGLWPFATLGWPKNTDDLKRYYPGSVLETGSDILFFWVARMMMFGTHFMGKPPFKDIYLHSMVRDAHGRKMSKSLGNTIDPIDVIEGITLEDLIAKIKTYPVPEDHLPKVIDGVKKDFPDGIPSAGADGLRLSLAMFSGQGRDVKFSIPRVIGYRSFLNKVWNATRFCLMNIEPDDIVPFADIRDQLSITDRYIISCLHRTIREVDVCIREYRFSDATDAIYHFFWNEYCDHYIECAKVSFKINDALQQKTTKTVLIYLLDASMRMLHPFCPFISEEIWQNLPRHKSVLSDVKFCAVAPFPEYEAAFINENAERAVSLIFDVCTMIKNGRQTSDLASNLPVPVVLLAKDDEVKRLLIENQGLIEHMARTSSVAIFLRDERMITELSVINASSHVDAVILLEGLIDVEKEVVRLNNALEKITKQKEGLTKRLANSDFLTNAPEQVIAIHKKELEDLLEKEAQLNLGRSRLLARV